MRHRPCLARPLHPGDLPALAGAIMAQKGRQWPVGATLGVRFLNGSPSLQAKVMARFHRWTELAGNLAYAQTTDKAAEIRVAFPNDGMSWSYIGTDALHMPLNQPTISLGWFNDQTSADELDRTGLHEIGHSRSYLHEHTRPEIQKLLDRAQVIRDLTGPPNNWTVQDVIDQVFTAPDPNSVIETPADINSIMEYPFSAADTVNHQPIAGGSELTAYDIQLDKQLYPWPSAPTQPTGPGTPPAPPPPPPPSPPVTPAGDNWTLASLAGGGSIFEFGVGHLGGKRTGLDLRLVPLAAPPKDDGSDDFHYAEPRPGVEWWTVGQGKINGQWFKAVLVLDSTV